MAEAAPEAAISAIVQGSEQAAVALRDDVVRVTRGRPNRWVAVHEIAERLGLRNGAVDLAVRRAIDSGWVVGDGEPPHSVRLTAKSPGPSAVN